MKELACAATKDHCAHAGLLVLRLGLGITFLFVHGVPKLMGGTEKWEGVGQAMAFFGITFAPAVWGFLAGLAEALGGLLLILGLWVRPAAAFLLVVMIVAITFHANAGTSYMHPLEMGIVFLALLVGGGGRYGLCALLGRESKTG
ncbi:MAG: DoxX family protein, partial [Planctomycetota bacterium]